jgi:DNA-directed RNA polymerase specialized sigma24 family protein
MEHRSTARRRGREQVALRLSPVAPDSPLADPDIARVVATLSPQQRAIVHLVYWEDRSLPETAAALGISVGSVKQQLDRARNRLRKVLS